MEATKKLCLVTGATGFIGRHLCTALQTNNWQVRAAIRRGPASSILSADEFSEVGDIDESTDWSHALRGVDAIVHLASRVHVMRDNSTDPLEAFRAVNVRATMHLATAAAAAGVRRFVFLSSIKVNGEATPIDHPFTETDPPAPQDPYGQSKLEAEQSLLKMHRSGAMEIAIIRPPLVYGAGVKGNMLRLLSLAKKGMPLPLGAVHNQRSMVGVGNLCALIARCLDHPAASGEVFLASDSQAVSTPDLIDRLARLMNRRARLVKFPVSMMRFGAALVGQSDLVKRLTQSLVVDGSKSQRLLDFTPPFSIDQQLQEMVNWYAQDYLPNIAAGAK